MHNIGKNINNKFNVRVSSSWAFPESKSIDPYTHGYHRYPAKFIPQLVKKLIEAYTKPTDMIGDVFAGCGTTLVESKLHGRSSIGVDINPVAQLITKVKKTAIQPEKIEVALNQIQVVIESFDAQTIYAASGHPRIDYWFFPNEKNKIAFLYLVISKIPNAEVKDFFLCALSNILKNCSRWLQSSTKPQVDPVKSIPDPFKAFLYQLRRMQKNNRDFYNKLEQEGFLNVNCEIRIADARNTEIKENSIDAIITSPPYVTSYEYADIHQLTGFWFDYISDLPVFRKNFIGTFYSKNENLEVISPIAKSIVNDLQFSSKKIAGEVAKYFNDMYDVSSELHRIVKPKGVVCLVVGNTTMRNVSIRSAEAFAEMLSMNNFNIDKVIKRKIPFKLLPTIRDKKTGKFTSLGNRNKKLVYPSEYIIIAKKA